MHAYFVNIKTLLEYIKENNIPLIWTFHCEFMYTGKCGHAYECTRFQNECGNCPAVQEYPRSFLFDRTAQMLKEKKKLLKNLDFTIITPSQWLADRVKKSFLKDKNISVIHNGIETRTFSPMCVEETSMLKKKLGIPNDYKVALSVAPNIMNERKGGEYVVRLAEKMKKRKLFFVLIGNS